MLVRSTASKWAKGSILAVDAGSHLAPIVSILQRHFPLVAEKHSNVLPIRNSAAPPYEGMDVSSASSEGRSSSPEELVTTLHDGPFAGLEFPFLSARANAVHIVRELVSTYLITHTHLDHLCGFVVNTAAFHNTSRPKRLAAFPFTVDAIKEHIFNDRIWPNLTDENNGVGFVTFQRLTEGGNLALGEGQSRGFIEVCDGLSVKAFKVSHGNCASITPPSTALPEPARRNSLPPLDSPWHPTIHAYPHSQGNGAGKPLVAETITRRTSALGGPAAPSQPGTPTLYAMTSVSTPGGGGGGSTVPEPHGSHVVDSTAYFIRAEPSGREILVFGDVEPDALSMLPRNHVVWAEAAPRIAAGALAAVFIECSYSDAQSDSVLFGHLAPRHLVAELAVLADLVSEHRRSAADRAAAAAAATGGGPTVVVAAAAAAAVTAASAPLGADRKRKRTSLGSTGPVPVTVSAPPARSLGPPARPDLEDRAPPAAGGSSSSSGSSGSGSGGGGVGAALPLKRSEHVESSEAAMAPGGAGGRADTGPLRGLRVVVIHVKDDMADGPLVGHTILAELHAHEARLAAASRPLGCEFVLSRSGESYWI
jgi:cAMP phosphodiesterase